MNLIFRMIYYSIRSLFRERLNIVKVQSRLTLRVLPNDLDINFHMNNGRYLTLCDLSRIDMFIRTGLMKSILKRKWMPLIANHTMTYKKPLGLFERFDLLLELTHWDEKYFYMNHTFVVGDRVAAEGTSKGCMYARGVGVVSPEAVLAAVNEDNKARNKP
ncbi:MAG TPA: acyl-CoA thioesterase [Gallionellaceae bacterium]